MAISRRRFLCGSGALAATIAAPAIAFAARNELTADTDFFVSPQGNDGNNGLTLATAKQTPNAMIRDLQSNWDLRGFKPTIRCSPGTYGKIAMKGGLVGAIEPLRITGSLTRGLCVINGADHAVYLDGAEAIIEGFTVTSANGMGLVATNQAKLRYRDMEFGACALAHIASEKDGYTYYLSIREDNFTKSNYFISAASQRHLYVNGEGKAYLTETANSNGIQFLAPLTFGVAFADVIQGGNLTAHTNAWSGPNPSGPAAYVRWGSVLAFAAQLPGNQALNFVDTDSAMA